MLLNEDLFDDVVEIELPEAEAPIVLDSPQRGPETPQEVGEASLLLDAIAATAQNIDNYNVIKVNMTDPDMIKVMEDIADMENYKLGKLQSLLKMVSPNAESIMNGAVEAEEQVAQDISDIQLESFDKDNLKGDSNMEFKSWIDDVEDTEEEREQAFIDEEVNKVMQNILTSYRKSTKTDESVELNEENLSDTALWSACCKHRYNFDKAKNWILNKGRQ